MIRVLHLGHSRKFRGGENQVKLLINGLNSRYTMIQNHIGYPSGATMIEHMACNTHGVLRFPSTRPYDPRCIASLVEYCTKNSIHIINPHSGNTHTLAYCARQFLPNVKVNVHRHVDFHIKDQYFTRKKYLSEKIDHFVAISSRIQSRLLEYGIADTKISVIKSTIDAATYQNPQKNTAKHDWCKKYNFDIQLPLLGFAGALEEKKDPKLFVQAISELRNNGYRVNALIAGIGPLESEIQLLIEKLHLSDRVRLTGFIENMPAFLAGLDIFVLPSKEEGLGTVLLEAIHSKCLCVASNVGGITEIIENKKTGMLALPDNVYSFVSAIKTLLLDSHICAQIKHDAIMHVNKYFDYSQMIGANYSNYKDIVINS